MSFEAVSGGDVSTLVDAMDEVDLEDDDISELHHEVFGIAGTLRHKIKELGIERKKRGKVMTKEQCDNIAEHIDDINTTWNEELQIALGKTNSDVLAKQKELNHLRKKYDTVMKANDHLKTKQYNTVMLLNKVADDIDIQLYNRAVKIPPFFKNLSESERERALELINDMTKIPANIYNTMVTSNEAFFKSRAQT